MCVRACVRMGACACAQTTVQLEPLKTRLLEQRLHGDVRHELYDIMELERQLARSLELIHTRKRQLEIKRNGLDA